MHSTSLAEGIIKSKKSFVFFHTWEVTKDLLQKAIKEQKNIHFDICVKDTGEPYLGHSKEYHEKSGKPYFNTMPLWEAVEMVAKSDIFVMVDCKRHDAWSAIEKVISTIGPERCLVCSYVNELKFDYSRKSGEPDFLTEWSPIKKLSKLKDKFPNLTTTSSSKWLPEDLLTSKKHKQLVDKVLDILKENNIDTVSMGIPSKTIADKWLKYFLNEGIIPHIVIDDVDVTKLSELYIGETDYLERASKVTLLETI